jgi:hypothetical protein
MQTAKHTAALLTTEQLATILERLAAAQTVTEVNIARTRAPTRESQ